MNKNVKEAHTRVRFFYFLKFVQIDLPRICAIARQGCKPCERKVSYGVLLALSRVERVE